MTHSLQTGSNWKEQTERETGRERQSLAENRDRNRRRERDRNCELGGR
jgi:hypothetical protein